MPSYVLALPIKDEAAGNELVAALHDEKSKHFHDLRASHGYRRIKIWRTRKPSDTVVVYFEADDTRGAMTNRSNESHEFEQWLNGMVEKATGSHPRDHAGSEPSELLLDWHHEKGASKTHHD
jgi:hypothetical protein